MTLFWLTHIAFLLCGLLAGTFLGSTMVEHAARVLTGPQWIAYKQAKEVTFGAVMPGFLAVTMLALVAASVVAASPAATWAFGVAVALLAVALAITVVVHLPINRFIQSADPAAVAAEWDEQRRRWRQWNLARCALAVLAFACIALVGTLA